MAFPGFSNGGCLRATHDDKRVGALPCIYMGTTGFRSFTRSNPARFAVLSTANRIFSVRECARRAGKKTARFA